MGINFDYGDDAPRQERAATEGYNASVECPQDLDSQSSDNMHSENPTVDLQEDSEAQTLQQNGSAWDTIGGSIFDQGISLSLIFVDALIIIGLFILVKSGKNKLFLLGLAAVFVYEFITMKHPKNKVK